MTTAYSRIDRFLRENLNDNDYPAYKEELDALCQAKLQRTWVGLTNDEIEILFQTAAGADEEVHIRFARAIESKLKELNI
jgi:hypothetical protein